MFIIKNQNFLSKILSKFNVPKNIKDDIKKEKEKEKEEEKLKRIEEMCKRSINTGVCPNACKICAWNKELYLD